MKIKINYQKLYMVIWGASFGLICACMLAGLYRPFVCLLIMITWMINAYLLGRQHGREKVIADIDNLLKDVEIKKESDER